MLSSSLSGVDEITPFATWLLAFFLLCYIAYFAIDRISISIPDVKKILLLLLGICILDDIVTYLQYSGNELGIGLGMVFTTSQGDYLKNVAENLNRLNDIKIAMPGIFGHGAINGYMASTLGILSMFYVVGNGRKYWKIGILLYIISLIGAFCCQERSGFGLLIIFSFITVWKFSTNLFKYSILIFISLLLLAYYDSLVGIFSSQEMGRFTELTNFDEGRTTLVKNAFEFIQSHFLLGGDVLYTKSYGLTPHNVILHSIIYSGVIGALVVLYLTYYMLRDSYRILSGSKTGSLAYFFACALSIYILNGLFHSSSLVTGDVIIWILYATMLRSNQLEIKKFHL